jgi:carnitine 3-dehydrogenase
VLDHLGPPMESSWRDLGDLSLTPEVRSEAVRGIEDELTGRSLDEMTRARDDVLIELLSMKSTAKALP